MHTIKRSWSIASFLVVFHAHLGADTIRLKNGSEIDGKVSENPATKAYVVEITGAGKVTIPRDQVVSVEKNDRAGSPAPAAEGQPVPGTMKDLVAVQLKTGQAYYGRGPIYGVESPKSNERKLVLIVPGGGEIQVDRAAVERIDHLPAPAASAQPAPAAAREDKTGGVIRTTHLVRLKNGSQFRGTVVSTPPAEPLAVDLGSLGRVYIPRDRVAEVVPSASEIKLPEPEPETPAPPQPAPAAGAQPPADREAPPRALPGTGGEASIDPELRAEIQREIYELTRWRHQNRTRSENHLKEIGPAALPYLVPVAHDPFELTRRAILRIVRDMGDPAGVPIAIDALMDPDEYVREIAAEALRRITHRDFRYHPYASPERRAAAQRRWREWWEEQENLATARI